MFVYFEEQIGEKWRQYEPNGVQIAGSIFDLVPVCKKTSKSNVLLANKQGLNFIQLKP